jgi:hypothetical protein
VLCILDNATSEIYYEEEATVPLMATSGKVIEHWVARPSTAIVAAISG